MSESPSPRSVALPGGPLGPERRNSMIRVDHAGEVGAVRIYEGQMAVLEGRSSVARTLTSVREMAAQEAYHVDAFDDLMRARKVRPTALRPLWDVAGFALGAATALLGEKAALACTAAVEEVIEDHYARQEAALEGDPDPELKSLVTAFRADETAHRVRALEEGAAEAPFYRALSGAIKAGCRLAIKLSEKI